MKTETLILKAKHFKDAMYEDICNCPLAKAGKEQFKTDRVSEGAIELTINGIDHRHECYGDNKFKEDLAKAIDANYDETVIREIELEQK